MSARGHRNLHTVCDRYSWKCYHCGAKIRCQTCNPHGHGRIATRDHFLPRSAGGGGGGNLVASCRHCNEIKADAIPGTKPPKMRSVGGCQYGRSGRDARCKRPHKAFGSFEMAVAMVAAVSSSHGVDLTAWACPGCRKWHVTGPRTVPVDVFDSTSTIRKETPTG